MSVRLKCITPLNVTSMRSLASFDREAQLQSQTATCWSSPVSQSQTRKTTLQCCIKHMNEYAHIRKHTDARMHADLMAIFQVNLG